MKKESLEVKAKVKKSIALKPAKTIKTGKLSSEQRFYIQYMDLLEKTPLDMLIKMKMNSEEFKQKEPMFKPVKKEKIDIPKIIQQACHKNSELFILNMEKEFCILIKKRTETVLRTLCPNSMNPVETQKDITMFNCFALYWPLTKSSKLDKSLIPLIEHGFPVHTVQTEYDVKKAIEDS